MNCPKCGALVDEGAKFCSSCGASVEAKGNTVDPEIKKELPTPPPLIGIPVPPSAQKRSSQIGVPTALPKLNAKNSDTNTDAPNFGNPTTSKKNGSKKFIISGVIIAILLGGGYWMYGGKEDSHVIDKPVASDSTVNNKSKQTLTIDNDKESTNKEKTGDFAKSTVVAYNSSTPDGLFYYYHQMITEHDLHEAYRCFSPYFQQQVSYDGWAPGYDTTLKSYPEKVEVLSNDGYKAVLSFRLMAQDRIDGALVVQYFSGQATLYKIDGLWKLDEISARKI